MALKEMAFALLFSFVGKGLPTYSLGQPGLLTGAAGGVS